MKKLTRQDLMNLETYSQQRESFRKDVIAHKKHRRVAIGPNATLYFEDRLTVQYQLQEMLRIERIFDAADIEQELAAYNPLIPDGSNWKATFMLEFPEVDERRVALAKMIGIEDRVWVQVEGHDRVYAIADEDMPRENSEKTSAVHFVRFELNPDMRRALKQGATLHIGIDHPGYTYSVSPLSAPIRESLTHDLD